MKYLLYIIILISFSACIRGLPDTEICETGQMHPTLETYFASTREGSEWIYVAQGTSDSEVVYQDYFSECNGGATLKFWSSNGYPIEWEIYSTNSFSIIYDENYNGGALTESVVNDTFSIYPPEKKYDSMVVNSETFQNVYYFVHSIDAYYNEYYFAPEIGIIRKVEHVNGTWTPRIFDLVSYDLKR